MTDEEMMAVLSQYIDLLNLYKNAEDLKRSSAVRDFENRYKGDADLAELMQACKELKILFLDGEID